MNVLTAISERQSVRAFLDTPVAASTVEKILETARWAPSGTNTQPWQVLVLGQATIQQLGDTLIADIEAGGPSHPDYKYYPKKWVEPYLERRRACGLALYSALGLKKEDEIGCKKQWLKNYHFFGAPRGLLFLMDSQLEKGSWMDMGMFIQNVMLAARGFGLETCAQASLADRPQIIRRICQLDEKWLVVCGMALGYADWNDPINQYRTAREPLDQFSRWLP